MPVGMPMPTPPNQRLENHRPGRHNAWKEGGIVPKLKNLPPNDLVPKVPCLFSAEEIDRRIGELAQEISRDYSNSDLVVVGVLKGAWIFMADLVRRLTIPVHCDFVRVSSYGSGTTSSGQIRLELDVTTEIRGRRVLIVEDIVDTGITSNWLLEHLKRRRPRDVRFCCLLDKPSRRECQVTIHYTGFLVPNQFVVGYGIDWNEHYRQLPYVGYLPDTTSDDPSG
ncbi:MAG: hypothetical protein KatS3mg105_0816 [Gemmatales bacterium]|nr:MAG: hypothetical protein KatS3mg105_0816 [Gemmatales bacterium]